MGSVERPALRGINPLITEIEGHPFVQVTVPIMSGDTKAVEHLFIPRDKVPDEVIEQIQNKRVKALVLNDPQGTWEITGVQLRPESGNK